MSSPKSREQTPTGAYRRALFSPSFPADDTDEYITFEELPRPCSMGVDWDPPEVVGRRELRGFLVLSIVTGVSTVTTIAMLGLVLGGLYSLNLQADDTPQITGASGESVDVIRD